MTTRFTLYLLAVLALLGYVFYEGYNRATLENKVQSNEKVDDAFDARSNFDLCPDGLWNYGRGQCERPKENRRN